MRITIEGDPVHLAALQDACEQYFRIALGQFNVVAKEHLVNVSKENGPFWYDIEKQLESACKSLLTPDLSCNSSYGIGNRKVSNQAHVCYELWKLLGGITNGPPLNYSGVALPKVTIEK